MRSRQAPRGEDDRSERGSADVAVPPQRRVRVSDGTELVLTRVTSGPRDLLLVPGGPSPGARWAAAAAFLEGSFACWLLDRRGKGSSGDVGGYSFAKECGDLSAVLETFREPVGVAAHSSGATVVLEAAVRGLRPARLVLYEPPWPVDGSVGNPGSIAVIESLIAAGDRDAALELAFGDMVGLPAPAVAALKTSPAWAEWRSLAHTWPREMRELEAMPTGVARLRNVVTPTLLIRGALTSGQLRRSVDAIRAALPASDFTELPGQGHGALVTAPALVADAIRSFAAKPPAALLRPR